MENRSDAVAYAEWSDPEFPFRIKYSLPAFHEIDFLVNEGFRRIPYGGVEHGGLLFGRQESETVQIEAYRQIDCEHASGPSFSLSPRDVEAVRSQLSSFDTDPELTDLKALGLFISHSRRDLQVTEHEQELLGTLFPTPQQLIVLVKPEKFKPTRFALGLRRGDGLIEADLTRRSFVPPLPGRSERKTREALPQTAVTASQAAMDRPAADVPVAETVITETSVENVKDPKPKRKRVRRLEPRQTERPGAERSPEPDDVNDVIAERTPELLALPSTPIARQREEPSLAPEAARRIGRRRLNTGAAIAASLLCLGICFTWFDWNYLQPPIQLRATSAAGGFVISWSPEETSGDAQAELRISGGGATPRVAQLSVAEKKAGRSAVVVPADDVTVELSVQHWMHERKGIVRVISQR